MSSHTFVLRWGIMATGHIAERFVKDLLTNPATRNVHDVSHRLIAVASSRSKAHAQNFCEKVEAPAEVKTYGGYIDLVQDPDVDIVYVATPISCHFQNVMLALHAGKAVLCEKALALTAEQARVMVQTARDRRLFLMEGVWTRFFPLSARAREMVATGVIGKVHRVIADTSIDRDSTDGSGRLDFDDSHRLVNPNLGGSVMLDLGIYSLTWIMQILYHQQKGEGEGEGEMEEPATTTVSASNTYHTGTDETTSFLVRFPRQNTMGIGMSSLRVGSGVDYDFTGGPPVKMQGSKGEIQVCGPAFRPSSLRLILKDGGGGNSGGITVEEVEFPFPKDPQRGGWGHGMYWEADECARCLRDGKLESDVLPLAETLTSMEIMDSILRQGGVVYPRSLTDATYEIPGIDK